MDYIEILNTLTYLGIAFILFILGKVAFKMVHKSLDINHILVEDDNPAFATAMTGYYTGLIIAIGGVIIGPSHGIAQDVLDMTIYGVLAIFLLHVSAWLNQKFIFRNFKLKKEIVTDRNLGTGFIEAANYISTGIIVYGAIIGEGGGILSALVFWTLAQIMFFLASKIYNLITPYDIHKEIEKDNVAVGLGYAGALIAIAILINNGIAHDFESWADHLTYITIDTGIGFLFLPLARLVTDKILLPTRNLTDEIVNQEHPNVGAALIEAFAYIGGAVLISWTL